MSDTEADSRVSSFLRDLPALHNRPPQPPHSGGLNPRLGAAFVEHIRPLGSPAVIETGAGNSTLLFLMLGCRPVTAIAPDEKLGGAIHAEAGARGLDVAALRYICDRSERALPQLALEGTRCQVAYIDGNHGLPSVFVDFCYLNMMLDSGGVLFIDDIQIYACAQLVLLLNGQAEFEALGIVGKMAMFRKVTGRPFLPDFRGQPFVLANSVGVKR